MSNSLETLRNRISGTKDLGTVVSTMKAVAAASISQYENAVASLNDYYRAVELGLSLSLRGEVFLGDDQQKGEQKQAIGIIVFGSDQGLVGQFNDFAADFVSDSFKSVIASKVVWVVGERMRSSLEIAGFTIAEQFGLPSSIAAITPLIGQIVLAIEPQLIGNKIQELYILHNYPKSGSTYGQISRRVLPFDAKWRHDRASLAWPTGTVPEIVGDIMPALIREYLYMIIFQACAESLASENASRLDAMQRAEKSISDMLVGLTQSFQRLRQSSIDEELFDVVSGFEALGGINSHTGRPHV